MIDLLGMCYVPSCRACLLIVLQMALKQSNRLLMCILSPTIDSHSATSSVRRYPPQIRTSKYKTFSVSHTDVHRQMVLTCARFHP